MVGHTLSRHKMRMRVRMAMEHLAHGETRLAHLAAEIGFSDQSHMCRSIRVETGHTPRALARLLA
jgi:AraC-like DNA-binding protein